MFFKNAKEINIRDHNNEVIKPYMDESGNNVQIKFDKVTILLNNEQCDKLHEIFTDRIEYRTRIKKVNKQMLYL